MGLAWLIIFHDTYLERRINGWMDGCYLIHPIGKEYIFFSIPLLICVCVTLKERGREGEKQNEEKICIFSNITETKSH